VTFRVLLTSAGGALGPLNIRLLRASRRYDVAVLAVDQRADAAARYFADDFEQVPGGAAPEYCKTIAGLVERHGVDLVLPASDEEALALAGQRDMIEQAGAVLACAPLETLRIMSDKARTYALLEREGIAMPAWVLARTSEDLRNAVEKFAREHGEFAVKPSQARGNRGTIVVRRDAGEAQPYLGSRELHMSHEVLARDHLDHMPLPAVVMEKLVPPVWDIDVLASNGRLIRAMPRRRMNPAGVPYTGSILEAPGELMELAERITKALKLSWLYDYDIMTTREGKPAAIEINPRPSGSIAAAILAGVPFYDDLIAQVKGEAPADVELPSGVEVIPHLDCKVISPSGG